MNCFPYLQTGFLVGFLALSTSAATLYVDVNGTNPISPYADWSTASTNIQDAVNAATNGDIVQVTNGVYSPISVGIPLTINSINGTNWTSIDGGGTKQCAHLADGCKLIGFTLTNGNSLYSYGGGVGCLSSHAYIYDCLIISNASAYGGGGAFNGTLIACTLFGNYAVLGGGGAYSSVLSNCVLNCNMVVRPGSGGGGAADSSLYGCLVISNLGYQFGGGAIYSKLSGCVVVSNSTVTNYDTGLGRGGGIYGSTAENCLVAGNFASESGGGAYVGYLRNCTVVDNVSGLLGGGLQSSIASNSIIYYNVGQSGLPSNFGSPGSCRNCCVTPMQLGSANITNEPLFVNHGGGDYHLQSNSPCVNSGNNAYVTFATDLDGNPRISGDTVDIGAYEFQNPASVISYAWLQQNGLPTDGSADFFDTDGDGMSNYAEWRAGTSPLDPSSLLRILSVSNTVSGATVTWQSVPGTSYCVQQTTNPDAQSFSSIASNLVGQTGVASFTDAGATNVGSVFYRVGVQ